MLLGRLRQADRTLRRALARRSRQALHRRTGGARGFSLRPGVAHVPAVVDPCLAVVRGWVAGQGMLDAVDPGCGAFHVGAALRRLILTEHLPAAADLMPNLDKPIGSDIRLAMGSGVNLTAPPFDLRAA